MTALTSLVNNISAYILNPLIFLMFAVATLVFLWGVQVFVSEADNPEARQKGTRHMIWGILGMAIMVGAKVLVNIIQGTATKL